jgi:hypothetical protein
MKRRDYIPHSDEELLEWLNGLVENAPVFAPLWDVPVNAIDDLNTKTGTFKTALAVANSSRHNHPDIVKKNLARDEVVEAARQYVNRHIRGNLLVTDVQRAICRLPIYDDDPTPSSNPTSTPVKKRIDHPTEGQVRIWIQDSITGLSLKPDGVHGWEARLKVCTERILHRDQLDQSTFVTHNPMVLQFDDYQIGMILSITFRYENTRGVKGPWSEIYYIIIS